MLGITSFAIDDARGMRTAVGCLSALFRCSAGWAWPDTYTLYSPAIVQSRTFFKFAPTNKARNRRPFDRQITNQNQKHTHTRLPFFRLVLFTHTYFEVCLYLEDSTR